MNMSGKGLSRRTYLVGAICACLLIAIVWWLYIMSLQNTVARLESRVETKGYPVRVATLEIATSWPPGRSRGQIKLERLFDIEQIIYRDGGSPTWKWSKYDKPQESYQSDVVEALDEFVTANRGTFWKMVRRIKKAKVGGVDYGNINPTISDEQAWVAWSRALCQAAVLNAEYGNAEEAKQYLISAIKLGRLVSYYPSLLEQLNRLRMLGPTQGATERCVSRMPLDKNQLHMIQKKFEACADDPQLEVVLSGYISLSNEIYYSSKKKKEMLEKMGSWFYPVPGVMQRDQCTFLNATLGILRWTHLSEHERLTKAYKRKNRINKEGRWTWLIGSDLTKALCDCYMVVGKRDALIRSLVVALAVKRFSLMNNRYPESLDELGDLCPARFLIDPYTGKLLKYRVKDTTYQVYSLGPDALDEGFVESEDPHPQLLVEIAK